MKLGFSLESRYNLPMPQVMDLLADAGFAALSLPWERSDALAEMVRLAKERNLTIQSLHGPIRGMPAMWSRDPAVAAPQLRDLLDSATDCAKYGIPILVVHPWNGVDYTFRQEDLCFDHFDAFMAHAESFGICVAFENLEGPEYLDALLERYSAAGFCWDSGHERCYTPGRDFLQRYGHRLVMTHLNDNLGVTDPTGHLSGTDDLHLLPGDGTLDWDATLHRLKQARPQEILNFELKIRPKGDRCKLDLYSRLPLAQYFRLSYARALWAVSDYFEK